MKTIKVLLIAVIALFTFERANAQVIVKTRVVAPIHRHYYHRRAVVYHRPYHRAVVVRHVYRRPHRRVVVVHR